MARRVTNRSHGVRFANGLSTHGDATIMCWAKGDEVPQVRAGVYEELVVIGANASNNLMSITWDDTSSNYVGAIVHQGVTSTWDRVLITSGWAANTWHCIVGTYNASTGDLYGYLDGVQFGPTSSVPNNGSTPGGCNAFGTDANLSAGVASANKSVAWCAYWGVVLSAGEIAALARGVRPDCVRPGSLRWCAPLWGLHDPEIQLVPGTVTGTVTGTTTVNGPPVQPFTRPRAMPSLIAAHLTLSKYRFRLDDGDLGAPP